MADIRKAAVLGLGVSGISSALFLHSKGVEVFASDHHLNDELDRNAEVLRSKAISVSLGEHSWDLIESSDVVILSPGISPASSVFQKVLSLGIPMWSEIELASQFCSSKNVIAITGTCGKTTMANLITSFLQGQDKRVVLCGNIGNPWISELDKIEKDTYVVLEVSSFQLTLCHDFKPWVGILLNISPNHLDWHTDMEDYAQAKLKLFQNFSDENIAFVRKREQIKYFSEHNFASDVVYLDEKNESPTHGDILKIISEYLGGTLEDVKKTLGEFSGLEHRMEEFLNFKGVSFINDSKSTTPASLQWALDQMEDGKVVLIAGGRPKSSDFSDLGPLLNQKTKRAIVLGEAALIMKGAWEGSCDLVVKDRLEEAVHEAFAIVEAGDTVLLSPACASFDMFKNYQERGHVFKDFVRKISLQYASAKLNVNE